MSPELNGLVIQAQAGDQTAYEEITKRFEEMAFAYAYSFLGDHELAEDARQEAFLNAYCDLLSLRQPEAFPGWFKQIVRKHALRIRRKRKSFWVPMDNVPEIPDSAPDSREKVGREQEKKILEAAIMALPPNEREAARRCYLEDKSLAEAASELNIEPKTVKSRLHTGRQLLRKRLVDMTKDEIISQERNGRGPASEAATREAVAAFDREIGHLTHIPTDIELRRAADLLCAKGRLLRFMGDIPAAKDVFQEAIGQSWISNDPLLKARFRSEMGLTLLQDADYTQARKALQASRRALENRKQRDALLAVTLNGLGSCSWAQGRYEDARKYYADALDIGSSTGAEEVRAEALNNKALLDWKAGGTGEAAEGFKTAHSIWRKSSNRFGEALTLMNLGILDEVQGRNAAARKRYLASLRTAREVGFLQVESASLCNLANIELNAANYERALEQSMEAREVAEAIHDKRSALLAAENEASARIGLEQFKEAAGMLKTAREKAKRIGDRERLLGLDIVRAELEIAQGRHKQAAKRLTRVRESAHKSHTHSEQPRVSRLLATTLIALGEDQEARATLQEAERVAKKHKNRREEKRISKMLRQLRQEKRKK